MRFSPGLKSTDVSTQEKWETCQLPPRDLTWPGGSLNGFTCSLMTRRPGLGQFPGCHRATIVSEIRNLCQQTISSGFSCYSSTRLISHFKHFHLRNNSQNIKILFYFPDSGNWQSRNFLIIIQISFKIIMGSIPLVDHLKKIGCWTLNSSAVSAVQCSVWYCCCYWVESRWSR